MNPLMVIWVIVDQEEKKESQRARQKEILIDWRLCSHLWRATHERRCCWRAWWRRQRADATATTAIFCLSARMAAVIAFVVAAIFSMATSISTIFFFAAILMRSVFLVTFSVKGNEMIVFVAGTGGDEAKESERNDDVLEIAIENEIVR